MSDAISTQWPLGIQGKNEAYIDGDVVTLLLTRGKSTVIDAEDWPIAAKSRWHAIKGRRGTFYAATRVGPHILFLHRILLELPFGDKRQGDHRDHDGLNNRRYNLRLATPGQNMMNTRKPSTRKGSPTSSRFKGVYWDKRYQKWCASIRHQNASHFIGYFASEVAAAQAYKRWAKELCGAFYFTNLEDYPDGSHDGLPS